MVTYELEIDEKMCYVADCNDAINSGPFIFWPLDPVEDENWSEVAVLVHEMVPEIAFTIIGFKVDSWDFEMSPWTANDVFKGRKFEGGGKITLDWLVNSLMPEIEKKFNTAFILSEVWDTDKDLEVEKEEWYRTYYIAGYSLAGLFSLWTYYESCLFSGVCSASGSLWFPGVKKYVSEHELIDDTKIYLSLGDREEKSKNKVLASVGNTTRELSVYFGHAVKEGILADFKYEVEKGNHFNNPQFRLAKGIAWLLDSSISLPKL
jgi:predicted alpha/beta superfamily hydrolase